MIWLTNMDIRKTKVANMCFFYAVVAMDTMDSYMRISGEIDLEDELDDVDLE